MGSSNICLQFGLCLYTWRRVLEAKIIITPCTYTGGYKLYGEQFVLTRESASQTSSTDYILSGTKYPINNLFFRRELLLVGTYLGLFSSVRYIYFRETIISRLVLLRNIVLLKFSTKPNNTYSFLPKVPTIRAAF